MQGEHVRGYPWHPHAENPDPLPNNTLYLAATHFAGTDLVGSGVLDRRLDRVLTAPGLASSRWQLLDWMTRTPISYHKPASIKDGYFQSAAKGQEFVIDATPEVAKWAESVVAAML